MASKWLHPMPVWVSRTTADGDIAFLTVPAVVFMFLGLVAVLNALVWGVIGLYEAVLVVL